MKKVMNNECGRKAYVTPQSVTFLLDCECRVRTDGDDETLESYGGNTMFMSGSDKFRN